MKKKFPSLFVVSVAILGLMAIISDCMQPLQAKDPRGKAFAGAQACRQCHQEIFERYSRTAHAMASSLAGARTLRGHFDSGKNEFSFGDSSRVKMEKRDSGFFQVLYEAGQEKHAYPFDVLFGYRHAQTGLHWNQGRLFELPLSFYFEKNAWGTSPGYPADQPHFNRMVNADCFDCHSSNISINNETVDQDPTYDQQSLIPGIDCERCHGPGQQHISYHQQNPEASAAAWMVRARDMNSQQKLDACAVCHSGNDKMKIQSRFEFQMGDSLGYFFMPFAGNQAPADVHGNQFGLMVQSKCFAINRMNCSTCHDPHGERRTDLASYSTKCTSCHAPGTGNFCSGPTKMGGNLSNCIDCHMPKQPSLAINFQLQGEKSKSAYLLRTHKIAVYTDSLVHQKK